MFYDLDSLWSLLARVFLWSHRRDVFFAKSLLSSSFLFRPSLRDVHCRRSARRGVVRLEVTVLPRRQNIFLLRMFPPPLSLPPVLGGFFRRGCQATLLSPSSLLNLSSFSGHRSRSWSQNALQAAGPLVFGFSSAPPVSVSSFLHTACSGGRGLCSPRPPAEFGRWPSLSFSSPGMRSLPHPPKALPPPLSVCADPLFSESGVPCVSRAGERGPGRRKRNFLGGTATGSFPPFLGAIHLTLLGGARSSFGFSPLVQQSSFKIRHRGPRSEWVFFCARAFQ